MKIKEVHAGVKKSQNYNSYSVNLVADLDNGENCEGVGEILIEKALKMVDKKMRDEPSHGNDFRKQRLQTHNFGKGKNNEKEVGAAWFSKKSKDVLCVQYSKGGDWKDVEIKDLKKISDGYEQEINQEIFIFRRIPEEKIKSSKMPVFRIYEGEKNEK